VREVHHHVRDAQQLAARAFERVRRGIRCVPLGDDVVVRHVGLRVARRNEIEPRRIAHRALAVHRVEEAVLRELGMEVEADEPALEAVVDRKWKCRRDVGVDRRLVVLVEEIQEAARVVREPTAVRELADEADARPSGGVHILSRRNRRARIRQARHIADLDSQPPLHDRRWQWIARDRAAGVLGVHYDGR
jgi:hypothetical protein